MWNQVPPTWQSGLSHWTIWSPQSPRPQMHQVSFSAADGTAGDSDPPRLSGAASAPSAAARRGDAGACIVVVAAALDDAFAFRGGACFRGAFAFRGACFRGADCFSGELFRFFMPGRRAPSSSRWSPGS